jgi:hypothetical protein
MHYLRPHKILFNYEIIGFEAAEMNLDCGILDDRFLCELFSQFLFLV